MTLRRKLLRGLQNPGLALATLLELGRGHFYRLKYRLLRRKVVIGRRFRVKGRLDIRGPGTVVFGDDCSVISSRLAPTTPYTHTPEAVIRFGDRVLLTGTRLGCQKLIEVGDCAGLADARIMDTDHHAIEPVPGVPRYNTNGVARPIFIGPNAWICSGAFVLKGVKVGRNSIVAAGAVAAESVPDNVVVFGNPARIIWRMRGS